MVSCSDQATNKCSDIALGYFFNIEFATDLELSLPFVREMCHYARLAVDQKKEIGQQGIDGMKNGPEARTTLSENAAADRIYFSAPSLNQTVRIPPSPGIVKLYFQKLLSNQI